VKKLFGEILGFSEMGKIATITRRSIWLCPNGVTLLYRVAVEREMIVITFPAIT
jgi:hypothetical protein